MVVLKKALDACFFQFEKHPLCALSKKMTAKKLVVSSLVMPCDWCLVHKENTKQTIGILLGNFQLFKVY